MKSTIKKLTKFPRFKLTLLLALSITMSLILIGLRIHLFGTETYNFLFRNIFLASISFIVSSLMLLKAKKLKSGITFYILLVTWLAFFPNAPYIITDFYHLKYEAPISMWFDIALVMSFVMNGLFMGLVSLMDVQYLVAQRFTARVGWVFSMGALVLSGFAIYIGRFLRFNTWDLVYQPEVILREIGERLTVTHFYPNLFGMPIVFSVFFILGYLIFRQVISLGVPETTKTEEAEKPRTQTQIVRAKRKIETDISEIGSVSG